MDIAIGNVVLAVFLTWGLQRVFNPSKSPFILFAIVLAVTIGLRRLFSIDTIPFKVYEKLDEQNSVQVVAENL